MFRQKLGEGEGQEEWKKLERRIKMAVKGMERERKKKRRKERMVGQGM